MGPAPRYRQSKRNDGPRSRRLTSEALLVLSPPARGGPRPFRGEEGCSAGSSAHPVFFSCFQPLEQSHIIALCPEATALLDANAVLCFIFSQATQLKDFSLQKTLNTHTPEAQVPVLHRPLSSVSEVNAYASHSA